LFLFFRQHTQQDNYTKNLQTIKDRIHHTTLLPMSYDDDDDLMFYGDKMAMRVDA